MNTLTIPEHRHSDKQASQARRPDVTFLMPCLDEERTIAACLEEIKMVAENAGWSDAYEIIVADNGSKDRSPEIARDHGARVVHVRERGYGNAIKGGISAALGEFVVMADADLSYSWEPAPKMVEKLRSGCDLVMGNRFSGGIEPGAMPPLHKHLGNPVLSFLGRAMYGVPTGDFHCGIRAFRRKEMMEAGLRSGGMEFASEMVVRCAQLGYKIDEVPAYLRKDGRDRKPHLRTWRDGWRHLRFLLVHCPRWVFDVPAAILTPLGMVLVILLSVGPFRVAAVTLDAHTMLYGALMVAIGVQAFYLGRLAGIVQGNDSPPRLEWSIVGGIAGLLAGASLFGVNLSMWASTGFGGLQLEETIRVAILSALFAGLGSQAILFAFAAEMYVQLRDRRLCYEVDAKAANRTSGKADSLVL